jgi:hypothetical protein
VSKPGDNGTRGAGPELEAFTTLERSVAAALDRLERVTERLTAAEARSAELEQVVVRFTGDPKQAGQLLSRLDRLESDNRDLRQRLDQGREGVERLLAKIRFLENQK